MEKSFTIETLQGSDVRHIKDLTPVGWYDVTPLYKMHLNQDYFFPIKLVWKKIIIGVGELIINKKNGWLGNIIVTKSFRNQGLGKEITKGLIEIANTQLCESIYLLSTPLGKPVYQKLGFQEKGKYLFYEKGERNIEIEANNESRSIIPYNEAFRSQIFELDKKAIGEDRSKVLTPKIEQSLVYKKPHEDKISGFFIPTLGDGVIICNNETAGFEFIKEREKLGRKRVIIPEECKGTINFLLQNQYSHFREATFMYLGKMKDWNPEMIFSRIGGFLG